MSTGDEKNNFGFIGAMGQALPFALGLSISQPDKKILLITGDGDTLMSLGSLATIANHPVSNLTVIVLDNESYVCLLYTSPSPRDLSTSRMPSSA